MDEARSLARLVFADVWVRREATAALPAILLALLLALLPAAGVRAAAPDPLPASAAATVPAEAAGPDGPAAPHADGYRSEVERAWFTGGNDLSSRAQSARTRALQLGATNYEGAARALLAAPGNDEARLANALLAARLAPDLPLARMRLAAAQIRAGQYLDAVREVVAGVRAIPHNLEATLWLAGSLLAMFAAVLTLASLVFILWVGVGCFGRAAHDLGDLVSKQMPEFARAALLASLLLVPVLLGEALLGLVLGFFLMGFMYREGGYRRALGLAGVLLVLGLYPVTRFAGMALTALDADPVASAAYAVVRETSSPADLDVLTRAGEDDWLAASALALHDRRVGNAKAALARYEKLREERPSDPLVLAVLANLYFQRGDTERSIELDERAASLVRSATILFDLAQVYARSFRMEEFEGAMAQAQQVDADEVAELSRTAAPEFVADPAFPLGPIRDRMIQSAGGDRFVDPVSRVVMPGRLGRDWRHTAGGFAVAAFLGLLLSGRWEHSSECRRCGRRICSRCDGSLWNKQICDGCHHLFHRPETTDPRMRMARLSELKKRESRIGRLAVAASLLVPGVGGLVARRPDLSFLGLVFFAWAAVLCLWHDGVVVDPLSIGAAGPLVFAVAGCCALAGYALVVFVGLVIRRSL